jgi:hypothetical protein
MGNAFEASAKVLTAFGLTALFAIGALLLLALIITIGSANIDVDEE